MHIKSRKAVTNQKSNVNCASLVPKVEESDMTLKIAQHVMRSQVKPAASILPRNAGCSVCVRVVHAREKGGDGNTSGLPGPLKKGDKIVTSNLRCARGCYRIAISKYLRKIIFDIVLGKVSCIIPKLLLVADERCERVSIVTVTFDYGDFASDNSEM
jgi:hypothetical protein